MYIFWKAMDTTNHAIPGRATQVFVEKVSLSYSAVPKFQLIYIAIHAHHNNISLRFLCTVDICLHFMVNMPKQLSFFYMFSYRDTMTNIIIILYTH